MTRVVVVEDHVLVRQSVVKTLAAEPDIEIVGEADGAEEAAALIGKLEPDLAVLDIEIPGEDGIDLAIRLKKSSPQLRILFLTMHDDTSSIRRAVSMGADGFVPKTTSVDELLQALRVVAAGGTYLSPTIARRVMDIAGGRSQGVAATLTERELEVLSLLSRGLNHQETAERLFRQFGYQKTTVADIAAALGMSPANIYRFFASKAAIKDAGLKTDDIAQRLCLSAGTVRNYLSEAIGKLHAANRIEAARIARLTSKKLAKPEYKNYTFVH
jgi:DNA-binding NarL/FixJ family response regulator